MRLNVKFGFVAVSRTSVWLGLRSTLWTMVLPGFFAGYVPWRFFGLGSARVDTTRAAPWLGLLCIGLGAVLLAACIVEFARSGRGTLSPVDPPRQLVVRGLYRYVRNPMYLSVTTIVLGEALVMQSWPLAAYWAVWLLGANLFVVGYGEPTLRRRFGASYEEYARQVGRWIPRRDADLMRRREMSTLNRRRFIQAGAAGAAGFGLGAPAAPFGAAALAAQQQPSEAEERVVRLSGDGLGLTPAQHARLLTRLAEEKEIVPDSYSLGGIVEEMEAEFARVLGKERAVFMPTGTLANHLAVRALAGGPSRVIVQEASHLYQDEGDCAQTLSNLTLIPLATGRATLTADEIQRVLDQTRTGRVLSRVSVVSVETPVRRRQGERFDPDELPKVVALARREGIRLHLDGARLFLQAAYTGEDVAETARPFDTVYVSLYKYFNAASGAVLAGPRDLLDGMYHTRRMFGGGLPNVWPFAAVALHYLSGFGERYGRAVRLSEDLIRSLRERDGFAIDRVPLGTNLFRLRVRTGDAAAFQRRLASSGVLVSAPQRDTFLVAVNETLNRTTAAELTEAFVRSMADSSA
ncbi:MAG: twin-arginine translocation signal domain-containing protein [Acidobacteria bacterium]|nr:twin-arginine translocation signal domain-containing protein [Acidobacteriota bacterium]